MVKKKKKINLFHPLSTHSKYKNIIFNDNPKTSEYLSETDRKKFSDTQYFIEATSDEHLYLWSNYSKESKNPYDPKFVVDWIATGPIYGIGMGILIGKFSGMPLMVSFRWAKVNNKEVCFFHFTSMVEHHDYMEKWLNKHFKNIPVGSVSNVYDIFYTKG